MHPVKLLVLSLAVALSPAIYCHGQDCDSFIINEGEREYNQREKSGGRIFHKPMKAEVWVNMTGGYLYLNMQFRDTVTNVVLRNHYGAGQLFFSFYGNNTIDYYLPNPSSGGVISIPLNANPAQGGLIRYTNKDKDTSVMLKNYEKMLELFFKERIIQASYTRADRNTENNDREVMAFVMSEREAEKLKRAIFCILKATQ